MISDLIKKYLFSTCLFTSFDKCCNLEEPTKSTLKFCILCNRDKNTFRGRGNKYVYEMILNILG